MSAIREAVLKGWTINKGRLQADGLFNAFRNNAETDDDITVWCSSREEAAKEALRMTEEQKGKWAVFKEGRRTGKLYDQKITAVIEANENGYILISKNQRWYAEGVVICQI